jgi:hypothetical protein
MSKTNARHGYYYAEDEVWDGQHVHSHEEAERGLIARMGRTAYKNARATIRGDLLAHADANVRLRAKDYEDDRPDDLAAEVGSTHVPSTST